MNTIADNEKGKLDIEFQYQGKRYQITTLTTNLIVANAFCDMLTEIAQKANYDTDETRIASKSVGQGFADEKQTYIDMMFIPK